MAGLALRRVGRSNAHVESQRRRAGFFCALALGCAALAGCSGDDAGHASSGRLTRDERALVDRVLASVKRPTDMSGAEWEQAAALGERAVPYLASRIRRVHGEDAQYVIAGELLATNGTPAAVDALFDALEHDNWRVANAAKLGLARALEQHAAVREIVRSDPERHKRIRAIIEQNAGNPATIEKLTKALGDT